MKEAVFHLHFAFVLYSYHTSLGQPRVLNEACFAHTNEVCFKWRLCRLDAIGVASWVFNTDELEAWKYRRTLVISVLSPFLQNVHFSIPPSQESGLERKDPLYSSLLFSFHLVFSSSFSGVRMGKEGPLFFFIFVIFFSCILLIHFRSRDGKKRNTFLLTFVIDFAYTWWLQHLSGNADNMKINVICKEMNVSNQ